MWKELINGYNEGGRAGNRTFILKKIKKILFVGSSIRMSPRCLPDASLMPPRCLPDATQMVSDVAR